MIRFLALLLFQILFGTCIHAQNNDTSSGPVDSPYRESTHPSDSAILAGKTDSLTTQPVSPKALEDTAWLFVAGLYVNNDFIRLAFEKNRFFGFSSPPIIITSDKKESKGKDLLFYVVVALLIFFALIRSSFSKYLSNLFRVVFRTTLKQRQIGEQLIQAPLPSLLLNFFFLLTSGLYIDFVLQHYHLAGNYNFWLLYFYSFVVLSVIYIIKYLSLKFSGWLLNISETTDDYIFIVFMINKIIGIYLLPFIALLAFAQNNVYQVAFVLSYLGVFGLLAYRIVLSYGLVRKQIRVNPFHFFLYLCAFEIVPLFVIYKALLFWF